MLSLVDRFHTDQALLEKQGTLIIRRLCALINAENIYRKFADILEKERDLDFVTTMVQALNLILLTASELAKLRALLKQSLSDTESHQFFLELYKTWCCWPMATISLCLLAQAYQHAVMVIQSLGEEDMNVKFLVQVDKLVRLIETPIFTYLRLQLLDPGRYPNLIKVLNGLLMLLPQQSVAFKILRTRLKTVPAYALMHVPSNSSSEFSGLAFQRMASGKQCTQIFSHPLVEVAEDGVASSESLSNVDFHAKLQHFRGVQNQHHEHRLSLQNLKLRKEQSDSSQGGDQGVDFYDISFKPPA